MLTGGGTAGHVNPLLTIALALHERNFTIDVLGTCEDLESDLILAAGFELSIIDKAPFPGQPNLEALRSPGKWRRTIAACEDVVYGAKCVVGFDGYVSTLTYRAAIRLGVPIVIHGQNAHPGLANRVGTRSVTLVALTFNNTPLVTRQGRTEVMGLPLRPVITQLAHKCLDPSFVRQTRIEAAARLEVDPDLPTLLIIGGSLGALSLNRVLSQAAGRLPEGVQVIHLTNRGKDGPVREAIQAAGVEERWLICDYLKTVEDALVLIDPVACRSGAGTVAKMTALSLLCVYMSLPVGNGEQRLNAHEHAEPGGAILMEGSELNAEYAASRVSPLLGSERLKTMAEASRGQGCVHATSDFADLIESVVGES